MHAVDLNRGHGHSRTSLPLQDNVLLYTVLLKELVAGQGTRLSNSCRAKLNVPQPPPSSIPLLWLQLAGISRPQNAGRIRQLFPVLSFDPRNATLCLARSSWLDVESRFGRRGTALDGRSSGVRALQETAGVPLPRPWWRFLSGGHCPAQRERVSTEIGSRSARRTGTNQSAIREARRGLPGSKSRVRGAERVVGDVSCGGGVSRHVLWSDTSSRQYLLGEQQVLSRVRSALACRTSVLELAGRPGC